MIDEVVRQYLKIFPEDKNKLRIFLKQIAAGDDLSDRENYTGHITGGAIILSPDLTKVLMIYHPTFDQWQQPGGHWDKPEAGPWITAKRESAEETGVSLGKGLKLTENYRVPIHIDSHHVPTKPPKNEPPHLHHDFRYVYVARSVNLLLNDGAIKEAKWVSLDEPNISSATKESIKRAKRLINS